jgi:hypothetical protein
MGVDFLETSHNKIDLKKFEEGYLSIHWGTRCAICKELVDFPVVAAMAICTKCYVGKEEDENETIKED